MKITFLSRKEGVLIGTFFLFTVIAHYRIVNDALNFTTGLLCLVSLVTFLFLVMEIAMHLFKTSGNTRKNAWLLFITITFLVICLELFLRFGLRRHTYFTEEIMHRYIPYYSYRKFTSSWFHIYDLQRPLEEKSFLRYMSHNEQRIVFYNGEFTHTRNINSLGLAEQEIHREKVENEYRIIALGDSFTEGMGTSSS